MKRCATILFSIILMWMTTLNAQVKPDGQKAWEHVRHLASDAFKGRKSGTPEYRQAAEYVAEKMAEYGLQPAGENGTYFQEAVFKNWSHFDQPIRLRIIHPQDRIYFAGRSRDFTPIRGTGSGVVRGQIVFVGYGVSADTLGWDDYAGLDVKDKIVLFIPGHPDTLSEEARTEWNLDKKVQTAAARGASGAVWMNVDPAALRRFRRGPRLEKDSCPEDFVVMSANSSFLNDLFYLDGKSWKYLVSKMMREKRSFSAQLNSSIEMEAHYTQIDSLTAPSVFGVLPGRNRQLKDEVILIGGHLDHLGVGEDGFIYNGADDNAGSVGVILELARVLKANKFKPERTLVFALWAGEELGLVGSRYYTEHPIYPLEKTAVYINMDMVGTGDSDLFVGGMWENADFFKFIRDALSDEMKSRLRYRLNYRGSDHSAFLAKDVTWISLRTGNPLTRTLDDEHPEYHRPGDIAETIEPDLLAFVSDYHYAILTHLANTKANLMDPVHHLMAVHKNATVADLHCDTIWRYLDGEDLSIDNPNVHIDIPKLKKGAVDLQVFACYISPPKTEDEKKTAAKRVFGQIDAIFRLAGENADSLAVVTSYPELQRLRSTWKTGALIGIEGGYAIESDLALLRAFYRSGVRLMTLTHWTHTDWADASGDEQLTYGGLSPFGEEVVREMNKLGMIIDVSHVHDETFWDVIRISDDPVVASHSCCRALSNHHRNLSDEMLEALAEKGGVIGINYAPDFLNVEHPDSATVRTVVDHIDHVVKVTGSADHVGLGSDFDGISSTPDGLENVGLIPNITKELLTREYNKEDIEKILGGNFIRVLKEVCGE